MYIVTEYQYQQLRNSCKEAFVDEIGRQPLKEEAQPQADNSAMDAIAEQYIMDKMLDTSHQLILRDFVWYARQLHQ